MHSSRQLFVSYKSEDRRRVEPLIRALEGAGYDVWWDARIGSGTDWRRDIEQHLNAAAHPTATRGSSAMR